MLQKLQRFLNDVIQINRRELGRPGAGEIKQAVDNFRRPESLLRDLVQQRSYALISPHLFGQHLGVGRNHSQGSVDLMGHTGRQQTNGREFVGLRQLCFQLHALGDVIHDNDAADHLEVARNQGRNGHIGAAVLAAAGLQPEAVEIVDSRLILQTQEFGHKVCRQNIPQILAHRLLARHGIHHFHLRVPALDPFLQVNRENADIDGLDDVLVEFLQALIFGYLLLQAGVQTGVLDRDSDIAGHGLQQLHVFAGEKVSMGRAPQADNGDGLLLQAAGKVIIQIEQGSSLALLTGEVKRLLRVLQEDVGARIGLIEVQKVQSRITFLAEQWRRQAVARHKPIAAIAAVHIREKDGHPRTPAASPTSDPRWK